MHSRTDARRGKAHPRKATVRLTDGPSITADNEAECAGLVSALVFLRGRIERAGTHLHGYRVVASTGSQLLVGQLTQVWQVQVVNLQSLVNEASALIQTSGSCDPSTSLGTGLVKVAREEIVRVLGRRDKAG